MPTRRAPITKPRACRCEPGPTTTATASTSPRAAGVPDRSARNSLGGAALDRDVHLLGGIDPGRAVDRAIDPTLDGDVHRDRGAGSRRALDLDPAAYCVDAVGDADHAAALGVRAADAVVAHDELELPERPA